jgi:hypothetical protein
MRVDIILHEISDEDEETSLKNIEVPRLPRIGETVSLALPDRRVMGDVTLVGHNFFAPGAPTETEADAWFVLMVRMSFDRQGRLQLRHEEGQIVTHTITPHEAEKLRNLSPEVIRKLASGKGEQ